MLRIELKTWTGDVKAEIKSFYNTIEHALQDTSLDIQKQEKLEHLKETPEDAVKATVLAISSLHENNKLAISSPSCKKEDNQNDICTHISNLKSILENLKYSDEAHNAYDDIYNVLETLNKTDLTKFDNNDLLTIEVIDISSEWACSYLKNNTIDFLKYKEECKGTIQKHYMNKDLKWVISENSVPSLNKWVKSVESQKHCAQKILKCLTSIWNLNTIWSKNQSERIYIAQIVEPLISVALENLPVVRLEEKQSLASKNYKSTNSSNSAVGDRLDIMFTIKIGKNHLELLYVESGRCLTTDQKVFSNHNKLTCLCKGGYNYITTRKRLDNKNIHSFLTILGINIAGDHMKIYGLQRKDNLYFYFPLTEACIPLENTSWENVQDLIYTLLLVRNIIIVVAHNLKIAKKSNNPRKGKKKSTHKLDIF
ncbi:3340_t:CDS:2 [Dentiscutata erythropus]|uniref:3340_t:CDS:1 n=1 Tax=Dentiscutata erythropus TaxID=1348616 RepID=A0A9N9EUG9_9GLOM|nr:3340_t:CDS:2 [Dentiscutata erythropus]